MNKDLQNALAFYQPAPAGWFSGVQERVEASGVWLWETLQGDFHDDPSTAQIVTGTVISMIPLVDQLCDVRDFVANCRKIDKDSSDTWAWVAMALTLIGAIPVVGSLFKGCLKVMFQAIRRSIHKGLKSKSRDPVVIEQSIALLNRYLAMKPVREALVRMKIHNAYQYLAEKMDWLKGLLTVDLLLAGFKTLMNTTGKLLDKVISWGPASLKARVERLRETIARVSAQAHDGLKKALGPTLDYLDALSNRLRVEADGAYRARPGNNNHVLGSRPDAELELIKQKRPDWVDEVKDEKYKALEKMELDALGKIAQGWPNVSKTNLDTFNSLRAVEIKSGDRLYRVVEPGAKSFDNGGFWMREAEFRKLTSKNEWRRHFAVWKSWNENGEYLVYTVPPGQSLKVWEGRAASQKLVSADAYKLEGGWKQILVGPQDLKPEFSSPRQKTGWGYDDGTGNPDLDPLKPFLGLPDLTHNWHP